MELETAIQQYLTQLKEDAPRDRVEFDLAVLARLQEFLEGDPRIERAESITGADLRAFVSAWLRSDEAVTPAAAGRLVATLVGLASWLDRQLASRLDATQTGIRTALGPDLQTLAEELPRAARAEEVLSRHVHRGDLGEAIPVGDVPGGSPLGTISAGISRVIRPAEVDYAHAEEDKFRVIEVGERSVTLLSPSREQLGEGPVGPVLVPARAARLLRAGDILHVEIAPTAAGWEILNVESVIPGGLDDRP